MKRIFGLLLIIPLLWSCSQTEEQSSVDRILEIIHNPADKNVVVISHRGDWRNFPENSIEAIENSLLMGADMIEIDVMLTADSVLILMHDRTLDRTTNGQGYVSDVTYDYIRSLFLKAGHGVVTGYKIPTLEEALRHCKDRVTINVDKGFDYYHLVQELAEKTGTTNHILMKGNVSPAYVTANYAIYSQNMMYMPIIDFRRSSAMELMSECLAGDPPLAYEVVWDKMTWEVEQSMVAVLESGARLWTNSLWDSLCGGLSDDKAFFHPHAIYGAHLKLGATMIQTDRADLLIEVLRDKKRHRTR